MFCVDEKPEGGSNTVRSSSRISGSLTEQVGRDNWIAYQRDSLARIFRSRDLARGSQALVPSLSGRLSGSPIKPGSQLFFLENSPAIRTRGRETIIEEFLARGYAWKDGTLSAADAGAGHDRNRWWFIAADSDGIRQLEQERRLFDEWRRDRYRSSKVADADKNRRQKGVLADLGRAEAQTISSVRGYTGQKAWLPVDAGIRPMVDGVPGKLDRIGMLGDAQVPLQAAMAWLLLIQ